MRERMEVGGYRLIKRLGYGGMSTVYEAEDPGGNRVALKLLHPSVADAAGRERLAREVQMLLKVTGPYVAEVIDAETEGADAFLVTELIDGPTLEQDVADQGVYAGEELAVLAEELRQAVQSIHAAGVLHRDLKPSNVMIGEGGPVLIDFGIAQLGDDSRLTAPGSVAQTPGYCDPRVLAGSAPDAQADWWALAAVLTFAATGRPPFGRGSAPAIMRRVIDGDVDVAGLDEPIARAFLAALGPKQRIGIDEVIATLRTPSDAERILPPWVWSLPLDAPASQGSAQESQASAENPLGTQEETEVLAASQRQETEVLPASERQATEVLPSRGFESAHMGMGDQATQPLAPIFDDGVGETAWQSAQVDAASGAPPGAPTEVDVPRTQVYSPAEQLARQGMAPAAAEPAPAVPSNQGSGDGPAIIGYDEAGNPLYAGGVTAPVASWAKIPAPSRLLVFLYGIVLAAAGGIWPQIVAGIFLVLLILFGTWGRVSGELRTRRLARGGKYSHDTLGATARLPWALIRTLVASAVSVLLGAAVVGLSLTLALGPGHLVDEHGVPVGAVLAVALFLGMAVAWLLPLSRPAREGARSLARALAPSAGYKVFWAIVAVAACAVFGMVIASGLSHFVGWERFTNVSGAWQWVIRAVRGLVIPS